jgi:hypothetical protein
LMWSVNPQLRGSKKCCRMCISARTFTSRLRGNSRVRMESGCGR